MSEEIVKLYLEKLEELTEKERRALIDIIDKMNTSVFVASNPNKNQSEKSDETDTTKA